METYITAEQARLITNSRLDEEYLVKTNMGYIMRKIETAAEHGSSEIQVVGSYLKGTQKAQLKTWDQIMKLGFTVSNYQINELDEIIYKIEW